MPEPANWLGVDWHAWEALATTALVVGGLWQVLRIRHEARKERTLAICNRYDTDPILDRSLRALRAAKHNGELEKDPKAFRSDIVSVLNYLDGVAIGIDQGLYIETLARDHLEHIVMEHCNDYLTATVASLADFRQSDYSHLEDLRKAWTSRGSYFKDGMLVGFFRR